MSSLLLWFILVSLTGVGYSATGVGSFKTSQSASSIQTKSMSKTSSSSNSYSKIAIKENPSTKGASYNVRNKGETTHTAANVVSKAEHNASSQTNIKADLKDTANPEQNITKKKQSSRKKQSQSNPQENGTYKQLIPRNKSSNLGSQLPNSTLKSTRLKNDSINAKPLHTKAKSVKGNKSLNSLSQNTPIMTSFTTEPIPVDQQPTTSVNNQPSPDSSTTEFLKEMSSTIKPVYKKSFASRNASKITKQNRPSKFTLKQQQRVGRKYNSTSASNWNGNRSTKNRIPQIEQLYLYTSTERTTTTTTSGLNLQRTVTEHAIIAKTHMPLNVSQSGHAFDQLTEEATTTFQNLTAREGNFSLTPTTKANISADSIIRDKNEDKITPRSISETEGLQLTSTPNPIYVLDKPTRISIPNEKTRKKIITTTGATLPTTSESNAYATITSTMDPTTTTKAAITTIIDAIIKTVTDATVPTTTVVEIKTTTEDAAKTTLKAVTTTINPAAQEVLNTTAIQSPSSKLSKAKYVNQVHSHSHPIISVVPTSSPGPQIINDKSGNVLFTQASVPVSNQTTKIAPSKSSRGTFHHCVATVPRLNLHLDKMLGEWYPAKISATTSKLWVQSFKKEHNISNIGCLRMEYSMPKDDEPDTLYVSLHSVNESTRVEAIFVGDDKHPKESKWAISWPNGEDTLTSVVAAGVIGKERNRYTWLLTVDCDLNGIVEPDWAVMARIPEGISNSTLTTILAIVEGLKGLIVDDAITYQSDDCHK